MKSRFLIIVLIASTLFINSSCKDDKDEDINTPSEDIYSSKKMEGRYLYAHHRDSIDYNLPCMSFNIRSVSKDKLAIYTIKGTNFKYFWMQKDGQIFRESVLAYGNFLPHCILKGKITYIPSTNPLFPYPHYEMEGAYFRDILYTDTVSTFFFEQISYDTMPCPPSLPNKKK